MWIGYKGLCDRLGYKRENADGLLRIGTEKRRNSKYAV